MLGKGSRWRHLPVWWDMPIRLLVTIQDVFSLFLRRLEVLGQLILSIGISLILILLSQLMPLIGFLVYGIVPILFQLRTVSLYPGPKWEITKWVLRCLALRVVILIGFMEDWDSFDLITVVCLLEIRIYKRRSYD